nr:MAG TPA: hypothetical protein [Bacteriophage sp.]
MCRLKEAFIIFWAVLTHRNYLFASSRHSYDSKKNVNFLISVPAEHSSVFFRKYGRMYSRTAIWRRGCYYVVINLNHISHK